MSDFICAAIGLSLMFGSIFALLKSLKYIFDYRFGRDGVDIVLLGGRVRIYRIKRENIKYAFVHDVSDWFRKDAFGSLELRNRIVRKGLIIRTTGWISWFLTPEDPEAALSKLGVNHHH